MKNKKIIMILVLLVFAVGLTGCSGKLIKGEDLNVEPGENTNTSIKENVSTESNEKIAAAIRANETLSLIDLGASKKILDSDVTYLKDVSKSVKIAMLNASQIKDIDWTEGSTKNRVTQEKVEKSYEKVYEDKFEAVNYAWKMCSYGYYADEVDKTSYYKVNKTDFVLTDTNGGCGDSPELINYTVSANVSDDLKTVTIRKVLVGYVDYTMTDDGKAVIEDYTDNNTEVKFTKNEHLNEVIGKNVDKLNQYEYTLKLVNGNYILDKISKVK